MTAPTAASHLHDAFFLPAAAGPHLPSASPPLPPELLRFSYQRSRATPGIDERSHNDEDDGYTQSAGYQPPAVRGTELPPFVHHATAEPVHADAGADAAGADGSQALAAPPAHVEDPEMELAPSEDILAPPLSPKQQEKLYSFTKTDYLQHLSDLLRMRVLAAILFVSAAISVAVSRRTVCRFKANLSPLCVRLCPQLVCILVIHYFSQGNWMIVLGCLLLMFASAVGIRGSMRADKKWVDMYYNLLVVFLALAALAFLVHMLVTGVAPTAEERCARYAEVKKPAGPYPSLDRCVWEMKINLIIETLLVAAIVGAIVVSANNTFSHNIFCHAWKWVMRICWSI
jgi:hypothetical protein